MIKKSNFLLNRLLFEPFRMKKVTFFYTIRMKKVTFRMKKVTFRLFKPRAVGRCRVCTNMYKFFLLYKPASLKFFYEK